MVYLLLLILAAIPALQALFPAGYFEAHDSAFHIVRFIHFYQELSRGQFPVRFSQDMAFGFGYPVFNFFYPLINYLGSVIHVLGFDFGTSLKIVIGASTVVSVLGTYFWLTKHFTKLASFVGAFIFLYVPYRFSATYVGATFGIVLAWAFLPLILLSVNQLLLTKNKFALPSFSLFFGCMILSHNVSAMVLSPLIAIYAIYLLVHTKFKNFYQLLFGSILSLGLVSFFLLPLVRDINFVNLKTSITVNYQEMWPTISEVIYSPWGYGYSNKGPEDGMSFQLGFAQWFVFILSLTVFIIHIFRKTKLSKLDQLAAIFLAIFSFTLFLMFPISDFLWRLTPLLPKVQFPWKLLTIQIFLISFLGAWLINKFQKQKVYLLLLLVFIFLLTIINNRNYLRTFETLRYPDSHYTGDFVPFLTTSDLTWESLPIWVKLRPTQIPTSPIYSSGIATFVTNDKTPATKWDLTFNSDKSEIVVANVFYYPNWKLTINNQEVITSPDQTTGYLSFLIPAGMSRAVLTYQETIFQKISDYISLISFALWLIILFRSLFSFFRK